MRVCVRVSVSVYEYVYMYVCVPVLPSTRDDALATGVSIFHKVLISGRMSSIMAEQACVKHKQS